MTKKKQRLFNWKGIYENGDGTFTTTGKREKSRLLKELHRQGVAVRSKRNGDGSWIVTPVGAKSPTRRTRSASSRPAGYRPRTRYPAPLPRRDLRQPPRPLYARAPPHPISQYQPQYRAPPRARGPGISQHIGNWWQRREAKMLQQQKEYGEQTKSRAEVREYMKSPEYNAPSGRSTRVPTAEERRGNDLMKESRRAQFMRDRGGVRVERERREIVPMQPAQRTNLVRGESPFTPELHGVEYPREQGAERERRILARHMQTGAGATRAAPMPETRESQNVKIDNKSLDAMRTAAITNE